MNILQKNRIKNLQEFGFNFDIGRYISDGFNIVKKDFGLFIGYTLIVGLILLAFILLGRLVQFTGSVSIILQVGFRFTSNILVLLISPLLMAGYFLAAHKICNREELEFQDFIKGLDHYKQLFKYAAILSGILVALVLPFIFIFYFSGGFGGSGFGSVYSDSKNMFVVLIAIALFIAYGYILVSYLFTIPLILFGDLKAWEAMETSRLIVAKNFWSILGFASILALLYAIGYVACCLASLFTIPVIQASIYAAFRDLMGFDAPVADDENDILDHLINS